MGLNIKNAEVERFATEVARMTGESKTEAIRKALALRLRDSSGPRIGLPTVMGAEVVYVGDDIAQTDLKLAFPNVFQDRVQ